MRDDVATEHIKQELVVMVVMEDVTEEERSAKLYVSVHGGLDHTFLKRVGEGRGSYPLFRQNQQSRI